MAGDILNGSGTVDATAYRAIAAVMGKDGGIAYRYGPSPADYGTSDNGGLPTYVKRNDTAFVSDQHGGHRPCNPGVPVRHLAGRQLEQRRGRLLVQRRPRGLHSRCADRSASA